MKHRSVRTDCQLFSKLYIGCQSRYGEFDSLVFFFSTFFSTFREYSEKGFLSYITKSLENVQIVGLVWNEYIPNSLKARAREKRGAGARRRFLPSVTVSRNWQDFLNSDDNKKELFTFLSEQAMAIVTDLEGKKIVATHGTKVFCFPPITVGNKLSPSSQKKRTRE